MRWSTLVATALMLLSVATASYAADNYESPPEKRIANAAMIVTYGTTMLVQLYDAHTTIRAINAGAREVNPLLAPFSSQPLTIVGLAAARAAAINIGLQSIAGRNKWAAIVAGAAINSAYLVAASHNNRVASGLRAQQPARP